MGPAVSSLSSILLIIICSLVASLNLLRGLLWLYASLPSLSTICCCGCCCGDNANNNNNNNNTPSLTVWKLSTNLTLSLGIVYGILSLIVLFGPSSWLPWCEHLGSWCNLLVTHDKLIPIAFTGVSILELVRWIFVQGQLSSLQTTLLLQHSSPEYYYNDDDVRNDFSASAPSESSRHRPWWWNRTNNSNSSTTTTNELLRDPLLVSSSASDGNERGQPSWTTTATSWIPFSPSRRRRRQQQQRNHDANNDNTNVI